MNLDTLINMAKQYKADPKFLEEEEQGRLQFINRFPLESLENMTIEDYAYRKKRDSFVYWLEHKDVLAGVRSANASKFGIYHAASGDYVKGFGKNKIILEGEALQKEFNELKKGIIQVIDLAKKDRITEIDRLNLSLFNMIILKILNIYVPDKFINIYTPLVLSEVGRTLGFENEILKPQNSVVLNYLIVNELNTISPFNEWSNHEIANFIWNTSTQESKKVDRNINYWLVGHTFENEGSILSYAKEKGRIGVGFLRENLEPYFEREDFYALIEDKAESSAAHRALKNFFEMREGDMVALKSSYTRNIDGDHKSILKVSAVGTLLSDPFDGYIYSDSHGHQLPVEWKTIEEKEHIGYGGYRSTINTVKNENAIQTLFLDENKETQKQVSSEAMHKNLILYGPPGTGKTYHIVDKTLEIMDKKIYEELRADGREALQEECDRLRSLGRIQFITFHQSYAYEDFIEGLKPDGEGNFIPTDGIFKRVAIEAMYEGIQNSTTDLAEEAHFEQQYDYLTKEGKKQNITFESKTGVNFYISYISSNNNVVITSKDAITSSIVSKDRLLRVYRYVKENNIDWENNVSFIRDAIGGSNQTRYWAVFRWIMERIVEDNEEEHKEVYFADKAAVVQKALETGSDFDFSDAEPYVVVIDEINRGNISKVFGELLILLEEDKRVTESNELIVELPYSRNKFSLPPNIYVIGTMNTADRSIALLDTALRRRFTFEEITSQPELLDDIGQDIDVVEMLSIMNQRIEVLYDRDHMIGHAYFIHAKSDQDIINIFKTKVIPLLQEYFYDDWEKIGLVLGGIGTKREDPYIVYRERVNVQELFGDETPLYIPENNYRMKKAISIQEIKSIYE